jgi:hypothetical protein
MEINRDECIWVQRSLVHVDPDTDDSLYWSSQFGWVSGDSGMVSIFRLPHDENLVKNAVWEIW